MLRQRQGKSAEVVEEVKSTQGAKKKPTTQSKSIVIPLILLFLFVVYVVIPLSVYSCPAVRRHAVFLNYVSLSRQKNLSLPTESGLSCTRNFFINTGENIKVGAWHIPPKSALSRCKDESLTNSEAFKDLRPVFLYLHGNAGTRAGHHRVELYKILSEKVDAHVLAFDYRGFGDSSNVSPTEDGVVEDTVKVFNWLLERVNASRIFVWGHSLGTGVGVAFLERLSKSLTKPAALILEAPFTRIIDAAKHHPLSIFHRYMPFFETFIAKPIGDKETGFNSIDRIHQVQCPLLILHAEDDGFVPFDHGKRLYEAAMATRKSLPSHETQFFGFDGKFDLGHKNLYKSPDLPNIVKKFIKAIDSSLV
ncbi:lysophosphatidylserine lipase ABHD12 [Caerostris darwini]|uniref:Lysophosphatidylserine lipase ABHD12 n=1 Tax=Caerostris darwini TaxID=1538125 RepID=A0AAV4QNW6_9ARAC|nr:lysophosphatidylserine lipase ABHD12 [Caerostris darwini]